MKIDYFFPVFKEDNAKEFLTNFVKSKFFLEHPEHNMFFVVEKNDENNLEFLSSEAIRHPEYKVVIANKQFTYNDAFSLAINYFNGDMVLLGDVKLARNDLIFESCLQKKQKNASVVHVVKKRTGFKGFWYNLCLKTYNFFVKLYTGKKDRLNIISLGLIDKNIIQLLQVLPNKRCFIKNTKYLKGFETRTIYVSPNTKVYKTNYKKKTNALITFFVSLGVFALSTITTIILNSLINNIAPVINIFLSFVIFASFILCAMNLPKHFFDCRNKDFLGLEVQAKMLNIETKTSEVNQNGAQNISAKDKNAIKTNSKTNKTNLEPNKKASNKKPINSKEKVNKNKKRTVDVKISKNVKASNQVKQEKDKKITKSKINEDKSKINN